MTSTKQSLAKGIIDPNMDEVEAAKKILKNEQVKFVLCAFTDVRGIFQSFSTPVHHFLEGDQYFQTGIGFDGSSIRGFRELNTSDMIFFPDPQALSLDEWYSKNRSYNWKYKRTVWKCRGCGL